MAHELGTCGQRDRLRINIADAPELNSWCAEFGCTPIQLRHAVGRVGVMAADVSAFLEREAGIRPLRRPLWSAWLRPRMRLPFCADPRPVAKSHARRLDRGIEKVRPLRCTKSPPRQKST